MAELDLSTVASIASGGGTVVLATMVWLQQRDMAKTLLGIQRLLGRLAERRNVSASDELPRLGEDDR